MFLSPLIFVLFHSGNLLMPFFEGFVSIAVVVSVVYYLNNFFMGRSDIFGMFILFTANLKNV